MRERIERRGGRPAAMRQDRLKFRRCLCAFAFAQVGLAAQIVLIKEAHAFIAARRFEELNGLRAVAALQFERGTNQGQVDFVDQRVFGMPAIPPAYKTRLIIRLIGFLRATYAIVL